MTRIAVCGGPYANPYALDAMLRDARARGCERIFCLGDLGGFGADCDAVWPLLTDAGVECIAGNYDIAIGRGDEDCGCGYSDPRDNELRAGHLRLHARPHERRLRAVDARAAGRSARDDRRRRRPHGPRVAAGRERLHLGVAGRRRAARAGRASGADVLLCTHTGIPWQRRIDGTLVVNVGAVGRPANDGRTETWYAVVDLDGGAAAAELVPVAYDWRAQAASMRAAGCPRRSWRRSRRGWWTTCLEVVPPAERARGRFQVYRDALPSSFAADGAGWADAPVQDDDRLPSCRCSAPVFPPRLWIYTNFDCNLACTTARSRRRRTRARGGSAWSASARWSTRPSPRDSRRST